MVAQMQISQLISDYSSMVVNEMVLSNETWHALIRVSKTGVKSRDVLITMHILRQTKALSHIQHTVEVVYINLLHRIR